MKGWAAAQFKSFYAAGFKPEQLTTFALADEPGWYFPAESPQHFMNVTSYGSNAKALQAEWVAFLVEKKITGLAALPDTKRWQLKGVPTFSARKEYVACTPTYLLYTSILRLN